MTAPTFVVGNSQSNAQNLCCYVHSSLDGSFGWCVKLEVYTTVTVYMNDVCEVTPCCLAPFYHGRGKQRASGAATPVTNQKRALRLYWDNRKYSAGKLKIFHAEVL